LEGFDCRLRQRWFDESRPDETDRLVTGAVTEAKWANILVMQLQGWALSLLLIIVRCDRNGRKEDHADALRGECMPWMKTGSHFSASLTALKLKAFLGDADDCMSAGPSCRVTSYIGLMGLTLLPFGSMDIIRHLNLISAAVRF
jgi:hypothetical protein